MTEIALLAQIIAQRAKVASGAIRTTPGFKELMEHGYLREAGVVSSLTCTDCDQPHDAEMVFDHGQYGYFCPDLGFVPVARDAVQALTPDMPRLIENLTNAFQCRRRKASPLQGQTWRIGTVNLDQDNATLLFHPCLRDEEDLRALDDALAREVRSAWRLIVTAEGTLPVRGARSICLHELVELDTNDGRLVPVLDLGELLGVPAKNIGGAPNRFGAKLSKLIENRITNGQSLIGFNEEAKAILGLFELEHPNLKPPSLSSVKGYLKKARAGQ